MVLDLKGYPMIRTGWVIGSGMGIGVLCLVAVRLTRSAWVGVVVLLLMLVVFLVTMCLGENGIIGPRERDLNCRVLYRWRKAHPRLFDGVLYGIPNSAIIVGISFDVLSEWTWIAWTSASVARREPNPGWPYQLAIWSAVTFIVVFISSAFVRERGAVRWGTACFLSPFGIVVLQPQTAAQTLCVASALILSSYLAGRLCFLDASKRICALFAEKK
jgi:hypothetical protein